MPAPSAKHAYDRVFQRRNIPHLLFAAAPFMAVALTIAAAYVIASNVQIPSQNLTILAP